MIIPFHHYLIKDINKLIENINNLNRSGYPFYQKLHFKLGKNDIYSINDKKKTNFDELRNNFNGLKDSFKKSQIKYSKENPIIRFIYGKIFRKLYIL